MDLLVETREHIAIIHIKGDCDFKNIYAIENLWNDMICMEPEIIALDCKELERIDSIAIGHFVKFLNIMLRKNIELILYDLRPAVKEIFNKASLNKFFNITTNAMFEKEYLNKQEKKIDVTRGLVYAKTN